MRTLLICCVVLSGCISRPDDAAITADLACETARLVLVMRQQPAPSPKTDDCHRCDGRGVLGDASAIRITCPDCKGTGKKLKSVLQCKDGTCPK